MIDYRFYLHELTTPDLVEIVTAIDEPIGWSDIAFTSLRSENMGGVSFEATINSLGFYGPAMVLLTLQKETYGGVAKVIFKATEVCDGVESQVISGRLNFNKYRRSCGVECVVNMPLEKEDCLMVLNNRFDQKVDIDAPQSFDKLTVLPTYPGLGFDMGIPAKELFVGVVGSVADGGSVFNVIDVPAAGQGVAVRPVFSKKINESINQGQLEPVSEYGTYGIFPQAVSPVLLLDDNPKCFTGFYDVDVRLKGTYSINLNTNSGSIQNVIVSLTETDDITASSDNELNLAQQVLPAGGQTQSGSFDLVYTNPAQALRQDFGLYPIILFNYVKVGGRVDVVVNWAPETHVSITASKLCPPTTSKVYLVNETLARIVEAITDRCMTVKSDYYGRTDSKPYASAADGCGGLRVLTSGLYIRQAENPKFSPSLDETYNDLKKIDNIGMGIEPDPAMPGMSMVRIEPIEYFYQNIEVLQFPYIPKANIEVDESKHYSVIKTGYSRWETGGINGLEEFNAPREFRTSLDTVKNPLDIVCNMVAGSYPLEITRQQSFAEAGGADTTYDNDTFIVCVERDGGSYKPEQGNIANPSNMFGPSTVFNWRISPLRNLMRWFKSIINSYANITNSSSKLFFTNGAGNLLASGQLVDPCALENGVKIESKDLSITDFISAKDYLPLVRPEFITFDYPFSKKEWDALKATPYGYCSAQCGNGEWLQGYVQQIDWRIKSGTAQIKLQLRW